MHTLKHYKMSLITRVVSQVHDKSNKWKENMEFMPNKPLIQVNPKQSAMLEFTQIGTKKTQDYAKNPRKLAIKSI